MKHTLQINVSPQNADTGIVGCRKVTVREKFLQFLLGGKAKLTVIVPGDSVEELSITEVAAGGEAL